MTISPWLIYWADACDSISAAFGVLIGISVLTLVILIIAWAVWLDNYDNKEIFKKLSRFIKITFFCFASLLIINSFIPSTKTVYKMLIIPTALNSPVIQKLPYELQRYVDKVLSNKDEK